VGVFTHQGHHDVSIKVKFGMEEYTMGSLSCSKFVPDRLSGGIKSQNSKFGQIYTFHPTGATVWTCHPESWLGRVHRIHSHFPNLALISE